jgi:hypothetical protein
MRSPGMRRMLLAAALLSTGAVPAAVAADSLGRLFTSPDQRNRLELRRQSKLNEVVSVQTDATDVEEPVASYLTIQGQVVRSNGEQTIFINGVPYTGREAPKGIELAHGKRMGEVVIVPTEGARPVQLKVGQSLDKNSLTIDDALLRAGTITIDRPAARAAVHPARRTRSTQ